MKKTKSYYNLNNINNNYLYCEKLLNIIPSYDISAIDSVLYMIKKHNNNKLICYNPRCDNKLKYKIYCLYDCYYCCKECKDTIKNDIEFYWNKI